MSECILRIDEVIMAKETEVLRQKCVPVPLHPPHRLIWDLIHSLDH